MTVQEASDRSDERAQSITTDYRIQFRHHGGKWTTWATCDDRGSAEGIRQAVIDADLAPMVRVIAVTRTLFVDTIVVGETHRKTSHEFYGRKYHWPKAEKSEA